MATKTPRKKFQAGKRIAHLFPKHHETSKRSEREDGKALVKVADRVDKWQPRSQGLSSLPPLVVGTKTLVAAGIWVVEKSAGRVGYFIVLSTKCT